MTTRNLRGLATLLALGLGGATAWGSTPPSDLTPAPGSPLRQAILDGLRQDLKDRLGLELRFVVRDLKARDGWAWVHAQPQSPDARSHYEDVLALLRLDDGHWAVVELPCTEPENPDCVEGPGYFDRLVERFPAVPRQILPLQDEPPQP
jgi:hypothetical protein